MFWPVTLAGAAVGAAIGGLAGALLGALLGHALDRYWNLKRWVDVPTRLREGFGRRHSFERVLFLCLGRLAKAEGRVEKVHLQLARDIMDQYRLDEAARLQAMRSFNAGKDPGEPVSPRLVRLFRRDPARGAELVDCCWRMALVNGGLGSASRALLDEWSQLAGLGRAEQQRMYQRHRAGGSTGQAHARKPPAVSRNLTREAAELLGVDVSAPPDIIKRAYRRQLSKHHPDKLVGATPQELAAAGERVHSIQQAYERLKRFRGFR
ncbi:DnaJ domain-containing protein [Pseudomonas sp.]|uniref:DnaJ domain-containing protein n=1 Tax=Pseudomonas sp. TaxID=306 RepID=UPI00272D0CA1|nr:DnaJ domain-containing protein [Pseudomonas sp.]